MLEGRKLSLEMQRDSHARFWTLISWVISIACILLLASVWIGMAIAPPPPDKSQDNMAQAHAQVLERTERLKSNLAAEQILGPELYAEMVSHVQVLSDFSQMSAKAIQIPADSRDGQFWPGRANLILEDLNTLLLAKEPTLNFLTTQSALSALYKPKGSISPLASAPLTAFREFNAAVAEWSKLMGTTVGSAKPSASSAPFTWSLLIGSKTPWRQLNAQMDALEAEAKLTENAEQAKAAQDLLKALNQNNLLQTIQSTDEQMVKVWVFLLHMDLHNNAN